MTSDDFASSSDGAPLLKVSGLTAHYDRIEVLHGVDFTVESGQLVALVGANGAGKTTLMRVLSGVHRSSSGDILFADRPVPRQRP